MKGLREKFRKHEGFTLVEMLIVVAIIAILVAVSIPLVNNALEKARKATDAANVRAAKAEMTVMYLDEQIDLNTVKAYNAAAGKMQDNGNGITPYGKVKDNQSNIVWVYLHADGTVQYQWAPTSGWVQNQWKVDIPTVN